MTIEPAQLTVCIVTWNVREDLLKCLASLQAAGDGVRVETIVVDNASSDGTAEAVREQFPHATLICNETNRGFAAANNQALAVARGEFLLLLNPDTVVPPGALVRLVESARQRPEAGIIGPKLLNPDGSLQHSCRRFPRPMAALFRHTVLGRLFPRNRWSADYVMADWAHNEAREVDWVSGAAMLIRRQLTEKVGLLDEGFYWGSEDVDYCYRAHQAGWKVLYVPEPAITHKIGASTNQVPIRTFLNFHRSLHRLYRKHFARNVFEAAVIDVGIAVRAALFIASWWARQIVTRVAAPFARRRQQAQVSTGSGG
jgi:GT2 family glycosyltransferase